MKNINHKTNMNSPLNTRYMIRDTSHPKRSFGFTLIELLVVFAIIGVISAVVVSSISGFRSGQALKNSVEETVSLLERSRSKTLASENSLAYGVSINTSTRLLSLFAVVSGSNVTQESVTLDSGITIGTSLTPTPSGVPDITFSRLTGETSRVGIITFTNQLGATRTITITKTGVISGN